MQLIKKIIAWLVSLFHMIFPKKNSNSKKKTLKDNNYVKKNNKGKSIITEINETMPSYMYLSAYEKTLLINQIKEIKEKLLEKSDKYLNNEIKEMLNILDNINCKDNDKVKELTTNLKTNLTKMIDKNNNKVLNELVSMVPINEKETILLKYNSICDNRKIINENISRIDNTINEIQKNDVTLVEKNSIIDASDICLNSKNTSVIDDMEKYNSDMMYVMKNINKYIIDKVNIEYKKINYITLSTELLDEISDKLTKIEDDYNSHRYNKYYYEREISKIKKQILELKDLKNKPQVYNEILKLRKELYTKSKDKYDILYNNEVFLNINQKCDDLINKVNAKVIDIKKENDKEKKQKNNKENEYLKNILLRFHDMNLARDIIMDFEQIKFENDKEMILYIKNMYDGFITNDIDNKFNFERNKEKTELVVLFNSLNKVNCHLKKEQYIPIEHINFRMNDLLDAVVVKKEELGKTMMSKYNIDITNQLVDDKMSILLENSAINKPKLLTKKSKKGE